MKLVVACACGAFAAALSMLPAVARAQAAPATPLTVLPPPAMNAPGAKEVAPAPAAKPAPAARPASAATGMAIPIPALPSMQQAAPRDARGDAPPTVTVMQHKGQLIEQYYEGGQLYMVQVHPKHGVTYSYFVDKAHNLTRSPGAPKISPVLYTLLEWGKPAESH